MPPIKSGATVTSEKLPEKVPELIKYADDIYVKSEVTSVEMENALLALDKAAKSEPKNFEVQWKAARTTTWLADDLYDDKTKRAHFSGRGIEYAKAALELEPKRVEGHYYSGINVGLVRDDQDDWRQVHGAVGARRREEGDAARLLLRPRRAAARTRLVVRQGAAVAGVDRRSRQGRPAAHAGPQVRA